MIGYKSTFFNFDWLNGLTALSSPIYKKILVTNQFLFWTGHIQSIVKLKNNIRSLGSSDEVGIW